MKHEVKVAWIIDNTAEGYTKGIKKIKKSGLWPRVKPQIESFEQVIAKGKIFSRDKSEINNLDLKSLTDHIAAKYEFRLSGGKNNIRLIYNVFIGDETYVEENNTYQQVNIVQFVAIGTHSDVRTTTSALQEE